MDLSQRELELIAACYDTIANEGAWPSVFDEFSDFFGTAHVNLIVVDPVHSELHQGFFSAGIAGALERGRTRELVALESPMYGTAAQFMAPNQFMDIREVVQRHNADYQPPVNIDPFIDMLRDDYGVASRGVAHLDLRNNQTGYFTVHFGEPDGIDRFLAKPEHARLAGHVARAVSVNRPFSRLRAQYRTVLDVLDKLLLGVFIVGRNGDIKLVNETARRFLDVGDALIRDPRGRLRGAKSAHDKALKTALARVFLADVPANASRTTRLPLSRGHGREPYIADVSPLGGEEMGEPDNAVIVAIDPANCALPDMRLFADLYALSASELAVARGLIKGQSNAEIAAARCVTEETVRSQVKAVLQKTRSGRRSEVAALAYSLSVPLAGQRETP